jgi:Trypsin-like peptidase domain
MPRKIFTAYRSKVRRISPMNKFQISVLVLIFHLAVVTSRAQQAPIATAETSPGSVIEVIRRTAGFIGVTYRDGADEKQTIGTCFFVSVPDARVPDGKVFIYLVTNRHVAAPGIDLGQNHQPTNTIVRLNLVSPQGEAESEQFALGSNLHWYFPQDESVDLAVLPLGPDPGKYAYMQIPVALLVSADQVKAGDVVVGDRLVFAGYFSNFPGQKRIEPIIREGVVAMLPDETLDTTLHKPGQIYLGDLHAFHGNSGSPVFVNVNSAAHHGQITLGEKYLLLGVLSGYFPESVGFSVPAAQVLTGEVRDNSGIATIVPADKLNRLLNSSELKAQRDEAVALLPKKP